MLILKFGECIEAEANLPRYECFTPHHGTPCELPATAAGFCRSFGDENDDMIYNIVNMQFMVLLQHVISSYSPVKSFFVNLSQTSRKKRKAKTEILQTS